MNMKANFIIELNEKHRDTLNKSYLWFRDVDINITPMINWSYKFMDNDESYYGEIIKIEVFKTPSTNEEELYITILED